MSLPILFFVAAYILWIPVGLWIGWKLCGIAINRFGLRATGWIMTALVVAWLATGVWVIFA